MKKFLIIAAIVITIIVVALVSLRIYTKQFSPQDVAQFENEQVEIDVTYSRPYKKDRDIFGGMIPYGKIWRTGANEATTFSTSAAIDIKGEILPTGTYSLFTIPEEEMWTIIFNSEIGQWGISPFTGKANRAKENDVLSVDVMSVESPNVFEQFTISFEKMGEEIEMILMWDQTLVVVPITVAKKK